MTDNQTHRQRSFGISVRSLHAIQWGVLLLALSLTTHAHLLLPQGPGSGC